MADRSVSTHPDGDREFELVLGNKQLFSLLFIMFVLLGVFFAMGYTLGRTSAPPETASVTPPAQAGSGRPAIRPSTVDGAVPVPKAAEEPGPERASAEVPAETKTAASAAEEPATSSIIDPKPGQTFMQVSAVARPEAELLVEVLTTKGFHAAMAPGPTEKLLRVLVGPAASDADLAKLKTDLEQSGFKPIPRRY